MDKFGQISTGGGVRDYHRIANRCTDLGSGEPGNQAKLGRLKHDNARIALRQTPLLQQPQHLHLT